MFSNLSQNSILYVYDIKGSPKILSGPVDRVSMPRPKYGSYNPMETVVDITATINGEKREFQGVPNNSIADFGNDTFILAESKDMLSSYINSMIQNSKGVINSIDRHNMLIESGTEAMQELNPTLKADAEKDKVIKSLQSEISSLKVGMEKLISIVSDRELKNEKL